MKKIIKLFLIVVLFSNLFLNPFTISVEKDVNLIKIYKVELVKNIVFAQESMTPIKGDFKGNPAPEGVKVGYLDCDWYDMACHGINFLQLIAVTGGNALVAIAAQFMDYFLQHSIQSSSYHDAGFIEQGWEILRNITNLVFIFALITLAFQMVLDVGKANAKGKLIKIILVALTINFSLFMAYAIIDISNVFAHVFYNKIEQKEVSFSLETKLGDSENYKIEGVNNKKSLSLGIAKKIEPQRILLDASDTNKGERILLVMVVAIVNGTLIYVFLSVAFLLLGRTIGLWLSAILAPLAFASITVPKMSSMKYIGFDNWFKSLLETAFMAPIFIFLLYLAVQFMNIDIASGYNNTKLFLDNILAVVIPMAAIVVLILAAKKVASSMAGDFAGTISGIVSKGVMSVGGVALATATGGAALVGRKAIGSRAMDRLNSDSFKEKVASGDKSALRWKKRYEKMSTGTFDFSKSRAGKLTGAVAGAAGMNMKQPSWAKIGGEGKGGYQKMDKDLKKEAEDMKKYLDPDYDKNKADKDKKEEKIKSKNTTIYENLDKNIEIDKNISELETKRKTATKEEKEKIDNETSRLKSKKDKNIKENENLGKEIKKLNGEVGELSKKISNSKFGNFVENAGSSKNQTSKAAIGKTVATAVLSLAGAGPLAGVAVAGGGLAINALSGYFRKKKAEKLANKMNTLKPKKQKTTEELAEEIEKLKKKKDE